MTEVNQFYEPKSNKKGEHLLDVSPSTEEDNYFIYDLTPYLPHWEGYDRKNRMDRVDFTIAGKQRTVYIIDYFGVLNDESARQIAIAYVNGSMYRYRLD